MSKEKGLVYPDGEYKDRDQVKREVYRREGITGIVYESELPEEKEVEDHLKLAQLRQELAEKMSPRYEGVLRLNLPTDSLISWIADVHYPHPQTDYERLMAEIDVIENHPFSFVLLGGDLVDGIHWGGASQGENLASLDEQHSFLRAFFRRLKDKAIATVSGEHDSKWAAKTGSDPYSSFTEITGSPYIRGVGRAIINVGEQAYKFVFQHRARGHSMYNKNHPTFRQARFNLQGADVYLSAHNHGAKQISQETIKDFDGARIVTHGANGAYVAGGEYSDRQGYPKQDPAEMYGFTLRLRGDKKKVDIEYDILEAHDSWS